MRILVPQAGADTLKRRRWGGSRLAALRSARHDPEHPIGESWEFSTMPGSESRVETGTLRDALGTDLPYLVKLIDTGSPLSVQVHPADDPDHGVQGKEEAWVILDAEVGATIPCGIRAGTTHASLAAATRAAASDPSRGASLLALLDEVPVRPGTVILVPARTVHAIPGGVLLAEIQQPTDCTYRLFDYGSGRPIHPDQALSALDVAAQPRIWQPGAGPTRLCGQHLRLDVVLPEAEWFDERPAPVLIIPVLGSTTITCGDERTTVESGALRLARPAPSGSATRVQTTGMAVIGDLPATDARAPEPA